MSFMLELWDMSLQDRWLQCCIRFWNRILSLPVDDLYRDVLSDSAQQRWSRQRASGAHVRHWLTTQLAAAKLVTHK